MISVCQTLSLDETAACLVPNILNKLSLERALENKSQSIKDGWNLQHLRMVCQTVFLQALGSSGAEDVIKAACRWLYNNSSADIPQCKEDLYYYCFVVNIQDWKHSETILSQSLIVLISVFANSIILFDPYLLSIGAIAVTRRVLATSRVRRWKGYS